MRELNVNEINEVSGGVLPLVVAVIIADVGLIGVMIGSGLWGSGGSAGTKKPVVLKDEN